MSIWNRSTRNAGTFKGTVDVRLRWEVPSLRRPAEEQTDPPKVFRGDDAKAQLATIWVPAIEIANEEGRSELHQYGAADFPDRRRGDDQADHRRIRDAL